MTGEWEMAHNYISRHIPHGDPNRNGECCVMDSALGVLQRIHEEDRQAPDLEIAARHAAEGEIARLKAAGGHAKNCRCHEDHRIPFVAFLFVCAACDGYRDPRCATAK